MSHLREKTVFPLYGSTSSQFKKNSSLLEWDRSSLREREREREIGSFRRERRSPLLLRERVFSQRGEESFLEREGEKSFLSLFLSMWGKVFLRERRGLLSGREGVFSQSGGSFSLRVERGFFLERREGKRKGIGRDEFCNLSLHQKTKKMKGNVSLSDRSLLDMQDVEKA